jgi:hypothetical protein
MAIWLTAQFLGRNLVAVKTIGAAWPAHAETATLVSI